MIQCKLCGSRDCIEIFSHDLLAGCLLKCRNCEFYWVDISDRDHIVKNHQTKRERIEIYTHGGKLVEARLNVKAGIESAEKENRVINFLDRIRRIDSSSKRSAAPLYLLEIGCGQGLFLEQARQAGYRAVGVEPNESTSSYAREKLGLDVRTATLVESGLQEDSMDVIVMLHVIEHLDDPNSEVLEIRKIMKDDGLLVIETPNI